MDIRNGQIHMPPTSPYADPTLGSCCQKDMLETAARQKRERITRAETNKRGLSFAPHREHGPAHTLGLNPLATMGVPMVCAQNAAGETGGSDEDLAFLEELDADGDEEELERLRRARFGEIKGSSTKQLAGPLELAGFGQLTSIDQGALLPLVKRADRVVAVLGLAGHAGTQEFLPEVSTTSTPADKASLVVLRHMEGLALEWGGTLFLRCAISSLDSSLLRCASAAAAVE